jgi:hypothetical protein
LGAVLAALAFTWHASSTGAPIYVRPTGGAKAINAAIQRVSAHGGEVRLGPGTYLCGEPIVISANGVTLRGAGAATVLRLADGANCPVIIVGDIADEPRKEVADIRVSSLAIDGNREKQGTECWGGVCDDGAKSAIRSSGIVVRRATDVLVEEVSIGRCRSGGLVTERGCRRLTVRQLEAFDNEFDGLACYETEDSLFTNLHLHTNKAAGISIDTKFNNNLISNAFLLGNGTHGIFMRDSHKNSFQGLMVAASGKDGIFLDQVDDKAETGASGNSFIGIQVNGSGGAAFRVNGEGCRDNLIGGCQFSENEAGLSEATPGLTKLHAALDR